MERADPPQLLEKVKDLDSLWNAMDAPASETAFQALLPEARRPSGKERGYLIEVLAWIARAQAHQGRLPESRASLDEAEALLNEPEAVYRVLARIRWLLERGRLHVLEKTPSQARRLFSDAWTLAINSGEDDIAVDIAQMMAAIEPRKAQQEWIVGAIRIAEDSPLQKPKRWLGGLYTTLGWKLYDLRQYEKSLGLFQKALRHLKAHGTERETFIAQWSTGKVLRTLGRTEEALAVQKALLAGFGIGGARDGRLYEELAECLQTLKRKTEAQLYFELAYRELSNDEWISDNRPVELKRMKDLGKVK